MIGKNTIHTTRESLAVILRSYGEEQLATLIPTLSDETFTKIGEVAADALYTSPAMKDGSSIMIVKALALGAIQVLEGKQREPKWKRRKLKNAKV